MQHGCHKHLRAFFHRLRVRSYTDIVRHAHIHHPYIVHRSHLNAEELHLIIGETYLYWASVP